MVDDKSILLLLGVIGFIGFIGFIVLYRGYIRIVKHKMETTV